VLANGSDAVRPSIAPAYIRRPRAPTQPRADEMPYRRVRRGALVMVDNAGGDAMAPLIVSPTAHLAGE